MSSGITEQKVFTEEEWKALSEELSLSPRQCDVIHHLLAGFSDKQIATKLNIAVPTVRTHLSRLFSRFNLQDREELILHVFCQFRSGCRIKECPRWPAQRSRLPEKGVFIKPLAKTGRSGRSE
jgi:DNA-binding CsgD family transcriptional regulator